ncbi:MAG: HD domain-containing protein [Planctomycetota bacterium]|jgi:exopolyphosphatase/guanosine-5'-triphosphate,3'-diphosphate pyrophosphatase|nr:HD domain-containing protein [Planctomycetota bacterium]
MRGKKKAGKTPGEKTALPVAKKPPARQKKSAETQPKTSALALKASSARPLLAAIDIGSTAIRMKLAELLPDNEVRVIEDLSSPATTGSDIFQHGYILPGTIHSVCHSMENFTRLLDGYGKVKTRAATSASICEASNSDILVDRIRHTCHIELEVLDAVEESRLVYQALLPWLRDTPGAYSLALNLGGGSTEIMLLRGEDLQGGGSRRLGTSRLFHAVGGSSGQANPELLRAIASNIVNSTRDLYQEYNAARLLLVNRLLYRTFQNDPAARRNTHDYVIPADILRERLGRACALGNLEISRQFNLGMADVELLVPAMLILDCFLEACGVKEATFANSELLVGLLREMAIEAGGVPPLKAFHRQIVRSARAVGERYNYDRAHARIVTEFSLRLFDFLTSFLDLEERDRLILEVAAVLHDVGMHISELAHHRHSAYLVRWADIVGLSEADRILAAQITYFHRMEIPSDRHSDFMALPPPDRTRVKKLAAILRLADSLDRAHRQAVRDIRPELIRGQLIIHLDTREDMVIIADAIPKKGNLLEMVTGLKVVVRRDTT